MVTDVSPEQLLKANEPMEVTELGMIIEVRPLQPTKARSPILTTELGIKIDVNLVHPVNAFSPIDVTEFGIIVLLQAEISSFCDDAMIALHSPLESYVILSDSTTIRTSFSQSAKIALPIEVTELGMTIEVNSLHP